MIPCPPAATAARLASNADWLRFLRGHPGWSAPAKIAVVAVTAGGLANDCGPLPSPLPHGAFWLGEAGGSSGAGGSGGPAGPAGVSWGGFGPRAFDFGRSGGGRSAGPLDGFGAGAYGPYPVVVPVGALGRLRRAANGPAVATQGVIASLGAGASPVLAANAAGALTDVVTLQVVPSGDTGAGGVSPGAELPGVGPAVPPHLESSGTPAAVPVPVPEPGAVVLLLPPLAAVLAFRRVSGRRAREVRHAA
ncbi:MAG TPA: hypothetical protein VGC15_14025 [Acetobacteraceae bacterium]